MPDWKDELRNKLEDTIAKRNKVFRDHQAVLKAANILEGQLNELDDEMHAYRVAIDPETFDQEAFKRGFQSAEKMAGELAHEQQKRAMASKAAETPKDFPSVTKPVNAQDELAAALDAARKGKAENPS